MLKKMSRSLFLISFLLLIPCLQTESFAAQPVQADPARTAPEILELHSIYLQKGAAGSAAYARGRRINLEADRVQAVLEFQQNYPIDENRVRSMGVGIEQRYQNLLQVRIPLAKLAALSRNLAGLEMIRLPFYPFEVVVQSQGVGIMGASDMQALGYTGQGVKVAIIDLGFQNLTSAKNAGEVPANVITVDYTGTGIEATTPHGTAVAEVVHDMAPDAQLYLLKIGNDVQLGIAKDYCITNGIRVINHSVAWLNAAFYDGTGPICNIANDAYAHGILWVNAAGNYANTHYQATLTDADSDKKHEFSGTDETLSFNASSGSTIDILLNWDDYKSPRKYTDYNLYLYNSSNVQVAASTRSQGPPASPAEEIVYSATYTGTYYIQVVKKTTGQANLPLDLYFFSASSLQYKNKESSLAQPADASGVLAVGAVDLTDNLRSYSSRGPTNDGRTKPDVTATDGTSNSIYGSFNGTSCSSPHTAGAAALILSQNPTLTVQQLWTKLETNIVDLGSTGKDTLYGAGRISLDADNDGLTHDQETKTYFTDPTLADTDGDGLGDGQEVGVYGTNPLVSDTDGDGLLDGEEVTLYGTNPLLADTDSDSFSDGIEVAAGTNPLSAASKPQMGDIAPHGAPDGVVDTADALLAMRIATGDLIPTTLDMALGDVAPLGSPDGVIDISDVLLIMRKASGLVTF